MLLLVCVQPVHATVSLAALFKNNAVLQRDMPVNVYGTASPSEVVTVTYARAGYTQTANTTADANGDWVAVLPAMPASYDPAVLTAQGASNTLTRTNILVGEVWLAAGQSNMQMSFDWGDLALLPSINEPNIRRYSISPGYSSTPKADYTSGAWSANTINQGAQYFSEVSFYFAKKLRDDLDVPVGMIPVALSGTRIRSWMSVEAIMSDPVATLAMADPGANANSPAACYNAMIHPILRHTFRGVIWYQGESDATTDKPQQYRTLFPTMIRSWRTGFNHADMPFYYVQLTQYNAGQYNNWVAVREAQTLGLNEPHTGMAVTIDSGEASNVHPHNKDLVGHRLGLLALKRTYGVASIEDSGPFFNHADYNADGTVRVHFSNVAGGLTGDAALNGFQVAGSDGVYYPASASIDAATNTVIATATQVALPQHVRYAWANFFSSTTPLSLANTANLPAAPFSASNDKVSLLFEAENIAVSTSSDNITPFSNASASNGAGETLAANAAGDYITYDIAIPKAGVYEIKVSVLKGTGHGQFQMAIDGVNQAGIYDQYGISSSIEELDLGQKTFYTAGTRTLMFTVTGRHASSTGYALSLDAISIQTVASGKVALAQWGACGHPTFADYQNWNLPPRQEQIGYLQELGCDLYRCSFEFLGGPYPALMDNIVPVAQAGGVTVLPILPLAMADTSGGTTYAQVYTVNYDRAVSWANYAISHGYELPYWELGNELENNGMLNVLNDGSSEADYTDNATNGFQRIRAALNGAYDGLTAAYTVARITGMTTLNPQMLFGATWRHWGLLNKIKTANGAMPVPWDILSWHWYTPSFGDFTATINSASSYSNGRTPVACLNDFASKTESTEPMAIWITEVGRSENISGYGFVGGSTTSTTNPAANQDWALQAQELETTLDDLASVSSVKAIIAYELFDEPGNFSGYSQSVQAAEAYFGLVTGLGGTRKDAFDSFRDKINTCRMGRSFQRISFHWGSVAQGDAAVLGNDGDLWDSSTLASSDPIAIKDVSGSASGVQLSWQASSLADQQTNQYWNPYDSATAPLMMSYLSSYQYTSAGSGAITFTLSGLNPNQDYTLIIFAAGLYDNTTPIRVTGSNIVERTITGTSRRISDGSGIAYFVFEVTSTSTGSLEVQTIKNGGNVYLNGFQLQKRTIKRINFNWGTVTQGDEAVLGQSGDLWNAGTQASTLFPVQLNDTTGSASGVQLSWQASSLADQQTNQYWNPYDSATAPLMVSYLSSYQYTSSGSGAITFTLSGLNPNQDYTLIIFAAGLYDNTTPIRVTGSNIVERTITGNSRCISAGEGVAYAVFDVTSSSTGTLDVRTIKTNGNVYLNGFQLQ